jgi:hypothetical protein
MLRPSFHMGGLGRERLNGAESQRALNSNGRNGATDRRRQGAVRLPTLPFAPMRRLGFRAPRDFAPFGIQRPLGFGAVQPFAP